MRGRKKKPVNQPDRQAETKKKDIEIRDKDRERNRRKVVWVLQI